MTEQIKKEYFRLRRVDRGGIVGERAKWDLADAKTIVAFAANDNVRLVLEPEVDSYFDVYGEPETEAERNAICESIERNGCYCVIAEVRCGSCGQWQIVDSVGMCVYNDPLSPYENCYVPDLMRSALAELA